MPERVTTLPVAEVPGLNLEDWFESLMGKTKLGMPQKMANEDRRAALDPIQKHDTVARMSEPAVKEIGVACEKHGSFETLEQRDDFVVRDASETEVTSHRTVTDTPGRQQPQFGFRDVFVEDIHAAT